MREAQGLSIRELARRAEVDHSYLSRFEAGRLETEPSRRWLRAVTDALAVHALQDRLDGRAAS